MKWTHRPVGSLPDQAPPSPTVTPWCRTTCLHRGANTPKTRHSSSASIATAFRSFTIDGPFPNPRVILTRPESRHRPASPVGCFTSSTAAVMFAIGAAAYVWTRWRGCLHVARNRVLLGRLSGVGYGSWSGWCWTGPVRKSTNPKGASSPRQRSRMTWPSAASASLRGEHRFLVGGDRGFDVVGIRGDRGGEFGAVEHRQVGAFAGRGPSGGRHRRGGSLRARGPSGGRRAGRGSCARPGRCRRR